MSMKKAISPTKSGSLLFESPLPQPCCLKEIDFWKGWSLLLGKEKKTVDLLRMLSKLYSTWLLSNTNPKHIQDEMKKSIFSQG